MEVVFEMSASVKGGAEVAQTCNDFAPNYAQDSI